MHISNSQINRYAKCPESYRRHYIKNDKRAWPARVIAGVAMANVAETYYTHKMGGEILTVENLKGIAPKEIKQIIDNRGLDPDGESLPETKKLLHEALNDFIDVFYTNMAGIEPHLVEYEFKIVSDTDSDWKYVGRIDLVDNDKLIRDLKTSARTKAKNAAENNFQLTVYYLGYMINNNEKPTGVAIDNIVRTRKGKTNYKQFVSDRTKEQLQVALDYVQIVIDTIKAGIFVPRPVLTERDWQCSYCEYKNDCKYAKM